MRGLSDDQPVHDVSTPPRAAHLFHVRVSPRRVPASIGRVMPGGQGDRRVVVVRRVVVAVWPPKGLPVAVPSLAADAVVTELHGLITPQLGRKSGATFVDGHTSVSIKTTSAFTASNAITTTIHRTILTDMTINQHTTTSTMLTSIAIVRPYGRSVPSITEVAGHVPSNSHDDSTVVMFDVTGDGVTSRVPMVAVQPVPWGEVAGEEVSVQGREHGPRLALTGKGGTTNVAEGAEAQQDAIEPAGVTAHATCRRPVGRAARTRG